MKEIKYCPYCRANIVVGLKSCGACGKVIPIPPSSVGSEKSTPITPPTPHTASYDKKLINTLATIFIVLTIGIVASVLWVKNNKESIEKFETENITEENDDNTSVATTQEEYNQSEADESQPDDNNYSDDEIQQDMDFKTQYDFACERLVTEKDLTGLDANDLRIMRNWIYARHGYIFKSRDLKDYFSQMPWYNPCSSDVSSQLSKIEKQNVEFIKRHE